MMPTPEVIDIRFSDREARCGELENCRRLGRPLPVAPQLEVFFAQPAIPDFLVNFSCAGGPLPDSDFFWEASLYVSGAVRNLSR